MGETDSKSIPTVQYKGRSCKRLKLFMGGDLPRSGRFQNQERLPEKGNTEWDLMSSWEPARRADEERQRKNSRVFSQQGYFTNPPPYFVPLSFLTPCSQHFQSLMEMCPLQGSPLPVKSQCFIWAFLENLRKFFFPLIPEDLVHAKAIVTASGVYVSHVYQGDWWGRTWIILTLIFKKFWYLRFGHWYSDYHGITFLCSWKNHGRGLYWLC